MTAYLSDGLPASFLMLFSRWLQVPQLWFLQKPTVRQTYKWSQSGEGRQERERSQYRYVIKQATNVGYRDSSGRTQGDNVEHVSELPGPPAKTKHHWLRAALGTLTLALPVYLVLGMKESLGCCQVIPLEWARMVSTKGIRVDHLLCLETPNSKSTRVLEILLLLKMCFCNI